MNTKANEIIILYSCDAWHSHASKEVLGVFTDWNTMVVNHLEKYLNRDEIIELKSGQTQGREQNYIVEIETLNPIYK